MTGRPITPAVGGTREVPVPDPIARDYLLLALRLDQRIPGLVDGYFGPADLKAAVELENLPPPARLRDDAAGLRARLATEIDDPMRRAWLDAQLVALETHAAALAGEDLPYVEHVRRCFGRAPVRQPAGAFDAAAAEIEQLLPDEVAPGAPLAERIAAWDARFEIPVERLPAVVDWLIERFRARAAADFSLPPGEGVGVSYVRGQPWTGYCWYDGEGRSRIDLNLDLPVRARELGHTIAHETYPGHHAEHAWKDHDLVTGRGWLEASVLLINTPECLISEGLAELGVEFAVPPVEAPDFLVELFGRAGLSIGRDRAAARDAAERSAAIAAPRRRLGAARVDAALLRHAEGASSEAALDHLRTVGRMSPETAAQQLAFIEHPLWRTYVFVYHEGEALLRRWVAAGGAAQEVARFGRLLREPLTPMVIAAELGEG